MALGPVGRWEQIWELELQAGDRTYSLGKKEGRVDRGEEGKEEEGRKEDPEALDC